MSEFRANRGGRVYLVGDWQDDYLRDPNEACGRLRQALVASLQRRSARAAWPMDPEDLANDKMAEWLAAGPPKFLGWPSRAPFTPYVGRIALNARREESRRCGRRPDASGPPADSTEDAAAALRFRLAELRMDLEHLKKELPRPHAQILAWLLAGETNRQIAARLHAWTGVRAGRSKQLVRECIAITSDYLDGDGELLRKFRARERRKKKNRWEIDPPTL